MKEVTGPTLFVTLPDPEGCLYWGPAVGGFRRVVTHLQQAL